LRAREWDVDIIRNLLPGDPLDPTFGMAGETVYGIVARMAFGRLPVPVRGIAHNRQVLALLSALEYDLLIVQSHLFLSNIVTAKAVKAQASIWLNHGSGHVPSGSILVDKFISAYEHRNAWTLRRLIGNSAGVSVEAAGWLGHFGVRNAASVGNAIDSKTLNEPRPKRNSDALRIAYIGRLESGKGAPAAVRLLARIPNDNVTLTMCGDGSERNLVQAEILAAGLTDRVKLLGAVTHDSVRAELAAADVLIYPSTYPEGFPTVFLEAGAAGCAVMTFPVGGAQEFLDSGGGWVVRNEVQAVAQLSVLAADPGIATASGEFLRCRVASTYTWPDLTHRIFELTGVKE
jgi:glycosyltransferase involved in cell wall biosynthesis